MNAPECIWIWTNIWYSAILWEYTYMQCWLKFSDKFLIIISFKYTQNLRQIFFCFLKNPATNSHKTYCESKILKIFSKFPLNFLNNYSFKDSLVSFWNFFITFLIVIKFVQNFLGILKIYKILPIFFFLKLV